MAARQVGGGFASELHLHSQVSEWVSAQAVPRRWTLQQLIVTMN